MEISKMFILSLFHTLTVPYSDTDHQKLRLFADNNLQ